MRTLKVLDLFSGIGGFALGLERAGLATAAFCEIDEAAKKLLALRFPGIPIFEDVSTLTKDTLDDHGITIDVIVGGFPCQDLSVAGKRAGLEGKRSGLWFEFHRLIKEIRPSWVIIENVSALRSKGLDQVLGSLAEIGYDAEWHCIPASAVGAPHRRDRIWVLAYPNGSVETDGGECPLSPQASNDRTDQPGGGSRDCGEGCVRSSGESSEDALAHTHDRCRSLWGHRQLPDAEKTTSLWRNIRRGTQELVSREWGEGEPRPYGVADGVPNRVDRLKQLGNAVVPQIPEIIGRAIVNHEENYNAY